MLNSGTPRHVIPALSTALLATFAAAGATGCRGDRTVADAHRALGTQLGAAPTGAMRVPGGAPAASADDLLAARRYLEATLRLDPTNTAARAALTGLGVTPAELDSDLDLAFTNPVHMAGLSASRAGSVGHRLASATQIAFGEVGAFGTDVGEALAPWATIPKVTLPIGRQASETAPALAVLVDSARGSADSAARDSQHARNRLHVAASHRRAAHAAEVRLAAGADSSAERDGGGTAHAKPKHKRTWPWTRAQRWLVAKGIVGGTGAGVVIGAIVGNVPGALLAGSLTGGAVGFKVGFKKATTIGPAAPYPSKHDSAAFAREKRAHDAAERAECATPLPAAQRRRTRPAHEAGAGRQRAWRARGRPQRARRGRPHHRRLPLRAGRRRSAHAARRRAGDC